MKKEKEKFIAFAENRINEHQKEISTRYQNAQPGSRDSIKEALLVHNDLFMQELDEKIQEMSYKRDPLLTDELTRLKHTYRSALG
jgi:hypothetical protein